MIRTIPSTPTEQPLGPEQPSLVLYGRTATGRPRAAWFAAHDADAATLAAGSARLRALPLADDAQRELGAKLVRGRVLPSGKVFVPIAQRVLYGRLIAIAGDNFGFKVTDGAKDDAASAGTPSASTPSGSTNLKSETAKPPANAPDLKDSGGASNEQSRQEAIATSAQGTEPPKPRPGDPTFIGKSLPQTPEEIGLGSFVLAQEAPDEGWWEAEVIGFNGRVFSLRWRDYPTNPTILRQAGQLALLPPAAA